MSRTKYKTLALEGLSMPRLLQAARRTEALYLTLRGVVRHVIMPADDGDQEVCALQNNAEFMAYLEDCIARAKTGKRYSLEEVKAMYGLPKKSRKRTTATSNGSRRGARKFG